MIGKTFDISEINEERIISQIRALGIDMIDEAGSGHPGIVLGAAPIIYSLYAHHMNIDTENPNYFNRDRFIMSAGHGSALLYATLYMAGYDLNIDDLKSFRQLGSKTPGHPEYNVTPGVDCSTGPLGQGFATAVGIAMAEANLNKRFSGLIDHYTYVLCGDGDLMEGVSYEAASLAGTLKLNKLIVLYDSNNICLDSNIETTFNDNISMRFIASGWNVINVGDGENLEMINNAINEAKMSDKPTLIEVKTTIGKYSNLEGTHDVHGKPLTKEDISNIKNQLDIRDIPFQISQNSCEEFRYLINDRCKNLNDKFNKAIEKLSEEEKELLNYFINDDKSISTSKMIYEASEDLIEAPRESSEKVLNSIVKQYDSLIGGSADLFGACKNYVDEVGDYNSSNYLGKNIYFGVREHAMGSIMNGLALHGFRAYGSTFLTFSDYMKPAIRMACMMNLPNIYIFTHDSFAVGEDGPTHQPVEQLLHLRTQPNLEVFRPADANEVIGAYKTIFEEVKGPSVISLARNKLPILDSTKVNEVNRGGYIVYEPMKKPQGIVISSGEELYTVLEVADRLKTKGVDIRVVSMPNITRFLSQDEEYIESVLPVEIRKISVEASSSYNWNRIIFNSKYIISIDDYGLSGKYNDLNKKFGFDVDSLEEKIDELIK